MASRFVVSCWTITFSDDESVAPIDFIKTSANDPILVTASIGNGKCPAGQRNWAHLNIGIMVDTSFARFDHCTIETDTDFYACRIWTAWCSVANSHE